MEAAKALEECDPAFKPVFASKPSKNNQSQSSNHDYSSGGGGGGGGGAYGGPGMMGNSGMGPSGGGMWGQGMGNGQYPMGQQSTGLPSPPSIQVGTRTDQATNRSYVNVSPFLVADTQLYKRLSPTGGQPIGSTFGRPFIG